jgi:hypothetical protein
LPLFRAIDADAIFDIAIQLILILIAITPPCRFSLPLSIFFFAISFQHIALAFELALADRVESPCRQHDNHDRSDTTAPYSALAGHAYFYAAAISIIDFSFRFLSMPLHYYFFRLPLIFSPFRYFLFTIFFHYFIDAYFADIADATLFSLIAITPGFRHSPFSRHFRCRQRHFRHTPFSTLTLIFIFAAVSC